MDDILHFTHHLGVDYNTCEAHVIGYQETILVYEKEFIRKTRESYNVYFTSEFTQPIELAKKLTSIRMEYEEQVNKVKHRMCLLLTHMVESGSSSLVWWTDKTDEFKLWIEKMTEETRHDTWSILYNLSVVKRQEREEAEGEEVD